MPLARTTATDQAGVLRLCNLGFPGVSFSEDVLHGLSAKQKTIPPKYFYDAQGCALFEKICDLPEYYPTRTEMSIMRRHLGEMAQLLGPDCQLIEFGSGASLKTRMLIEAAQPALYVPIDIAEFQLKAACEDLAARYAWLNIIGVCADYTVELALPEFVGVPIRRKAVFFPGSTIGNFTPFEAQAFLAMTRRMVGPGGVLLIGVDLKKDVRMLDAAYNDAQGVTALFNLNLLERINRELQGDFQVQRFRHKAFYDEAKGRIEMHLESLVSQLVHVAGQRFDFRPEETIHTEVSCKYSIEEFQELGRRAHFQPGKVWIDPDNLFSVHGMIAA